MQQKCKQMNKKNEIFLIELLRFGDCNSIRPRNMIGLKPSRIKLLYSQAKAMKQKNTSQQKNKPGVLEAIVQFKPYLKYDWFKTKL